MSTENNWQEDIKRVVMRSFASGLELGRQEGRKVRNDTLIAVIAVSLGVGIAFGLLMADPAPECAVLTEVSL